VPGLPLALLVGDAAVSTEAGRVVAARRHCAGGLAVGRAPTSGAAAVGCSLGGAGRRAAGIWVCRAMYRACAWLVGRPPC
jgi:hypothetical protein